jgi:hypothetical protein
MKWKSACRVINTNLMHPLCKRGRLVSIMNIPLQITKKSVNIAVNKIKPLNGKHHEGI